MNNPNRHHDELWEQIAAYEENQMDASQKISFETQLCADSSLRKMLDSWRITMQSAKDWYDIPVKGDDRIDSLPIPFLSRPKPVPQWYRWLSKAAIFVVGFGLGICVEKGIGMWSNSPKQPAMHSQSQPDSDNSRANQVITVRPDKVEQPAESKEIESKPAGATGSVEPRYTQQSDGRLVIETKMQKSGSQAVWIVDGNFKLSQNNSVQ